MIKKVASIIGIVVICFGTLYYVDGKEYLSGEEKHYIGTSIISANELVILADRSNTLPSYSITGIEQQGYGKVEITYDFYSDEYYLFLIAAPFSILDTNIINILYGARLQWAICGLIIIGFVVGVKLYQHYIASVGVFSKIKIENAAWYILHPQRLFIRKEALGLFAARIELDINVQPAGKGIFGARTWKYKDGYLYSSGLGQARWENKVLLADETPEGNNKNGVYACRLGTVDNDWEFMKHIIGIVSLSGEWFEHADGVLRAESCEIISLIVSHYHKPIASTLSSTYGVPVIVADNPINAYMNWLFSDNGMSCLKHNKKILKGGIDGNKGARNQEGEVTVEIASGSSRS